MYLKLTFMEAVSPIAEERQVVTIVGLIEGETRVREWVELLQVEPQLMQPVLDAVSRCIEAALQSDEFRRAHPHLIQ